MTLCYLSAWTVMVTGQQGVKQGVQSGCFEIDRLVLTSTDTTDATVLTPCFP